MKSLAPFNQSFNPADGACRHHKGRPLVAGVLDEIVILERRASRARER
jgi:hypothetical protein